MKRLAIFLTFAAAMAHGQISNPPHFIIGSTIASSLPTAANASNQFWTVTDGASATDCSTGGGSTGVLCYSNGTTWVPVGGAAASCSNALTMNNSNSGAASGATFNCSAAVTLSANTLGAGSLANANTWSAANTISGNGAASVSPLLMTGTIFTGGTGTTTFPAFLIQPTAATGATNYSTSGTIFGINTASGFAGNILDFKINGATTSRLTLDNGGTLTTGTAVNSGQFTETAQLVSIGNSAANAIRIGSTSVQSWSSTAAYNGGSDTGLDRSAAGILEVDLGTAQGSGGSLKSAALIAGGTTFTVTGCGTAGSVTGGATAGTFTVGTGAATCTFVFTINGATGLTAPHGWIANVDDTTAHLHCTNTTTVSTTTANVLCNATVTTSDLITFSAVAY